MTSSSDVRGFPVRRGAAARPPLALLEYLLLTTQTHALCGSMAFFAILGFYPLSLLLMSLAKYVLRSPEALDVVRLILYSYFPVGQDCLLRNLETSSRVYGDVTTAGRQVVLKVGPSPDGTGSREVTVVPVDDELGLRNLAWIEGNRRKVDEMTGGRVAYVYLPDTYSGGYTNFNRYYFAQVGKEAAIIDERFNRGGDIADYGIDYLRRRFLSFWTMREGQDMTTPIEGIFGPKVMIINEMAGSGGDATLSGFGS